MKFYPIHFLQVEEGGEDDIQITLASYSNTLQVRTSKKNDDVSTHS